MDLLIKIFGFILFVTIPIILCTLLVDDEIKIDKEKEKREAEKKFADKCKRNFKITVHNEKD